jgi:hypothetical protein
MFFIPVPKIACFGEFPVCGSFEPIDERTYFPQPGSNTIAGGFLSDLANEVKREWNASL